MKTIVNILPLLVLSFGPATMATELNIDCHNQGVDGLSAVAGGIINTDEDSGDVYGSGVPAKGTITVKLFEPTFSGNKRIRTDEDVAIAGTYAIFPHGQTLSASAVSAESTVIKEIEINTAVTEVSLVILNNGDVHKMACSIEKFED